MALIIIKQLIYPYYSQQGIRLLSFGRTCVCVCVCVCLWQISGKLCVLSLLVTFKCSFSRPWLHFSTSQTCR